MRHAAAIHALAASVAATGCTVILGVGDIPTPTDAGVKDGGSEARADARVDAGPPDGPCEGGLMRCSGACVDTTTSKENCGGCGSACDGTCTMGHCVIVIAKNQHGSYSLAVAGSRVYWTTSSTVMSGDVSGGFLRTIAKNQQFPLGIAFASTATIWADSFGGTVMKYDFTKSAVSTLASGLSSPVAVALDTANAYFATDSEIDFVPIAGGSVSTLATGQNGPDSVAVDMNNVYWTNAGSMNNGSVQQAPKSGPDAGIVLVLASNLPAPQAVAVDSAFVYWTNAGSFCASDGSVMRVPIGGGTPTTIAEKQGTPNGLAVDGSGIYWANNLEGTIRRAPLGGGPSTVVASGQDAPVAVAVDASHVYFTTEGGLTIVSVTKD